MVEGLKGRGCPSGGRPDNVGRKMAAVHRHVASIAALQMAMTMVFLLLMLMLKMLMMAKMSRAGHFGLR